MRKCLSCENKKYMFREKRAGLDLWLLAVHVEHGQFIVNQLHPNGGERGLLLQLTGSAFNVLNHHLGIPAQGVEEGMLEIFRISLKWHSSSTLYREYDAVWNTSSVMLVTFFKQQSKKATGESKQVANLFSPAIAMMWGFLLFRNFFRVSISWI